MTHVYTYSPAAMKAPAGGSKGWNKTVSPRGIAAENNLLLEKRFLPLPAAAEPIVWHANAADNYPRKHAKTDLLVANIDTVSAGILLGNDTVVLSFGNHATPGGRYTHDGLAQEEDVCRLLPQLQPSLIASNAYPLKTGTALLSKDLIVAREPLSYRLLRKKSEPQEKESLLESEQEPTQDNQTLSVITASMPCGPMDGGRPKGGWLSSPWSETVSTCIKSILLAAVISGKSNLVLGAIGCGAFGNPTRPVAQLFRYILEGEEFRGFFQKIVFAIIDPIGTGNMKPFREEISAILPRVLTNQRNDTHDEKDEFV